MLSGAMLDPSALRDLVPDFKEKGAPLASEVHDEHVYFLTKTGKIPFPIIPPPLQNHGNYIISLNRFVKWLAGLVEAEGIDFFAGFPASEVLYEDDRVVGVRTRDQGIDKHGAKKSTFEAGRRHPRQGHDPLRRRPRQPDQGARAPARARRRAGSRSSTRIGIKELWEVPKDRIEPGTVIHTLGYPLRMEEFGGAFLYAMPDGLVSFGLVTGLDYQDPMFDPHQAFQHFKQHPVVRVDPRRAARWFATAPRRCPRAAGTRSRGVYADGVLIAGDAGGFVNSMRLKGIHLAMRTGMLAAETAFEADPRQRHVGGAAARATRRPINASEVRRELYPVRNVHQSFSHGLLAGHDVLGAVAGDRRLVAEGSDAGARRLRAHAEAGGLLRRQPPGRRRAGATRRRSTGS